MDQIFPILCDTCGEAIRTPDEGSALWIRSQKPEIEINHTPGQQPGCERHLPDDLVAILPLTEALGPGGLVALCEQVKKHPEFAVSCAETIERLFVPGYDRLRSVQQSAPTV